jgi:indolepyruvate ferredoxin oxidoreductase beta subunit
VETNLILSGVGGQGILTIARALSTAALRRGLYVKQAEVHGMSQRGGEVQSHLRISSRELSSDLIPLGRADIVVAVEPLESLRYVHYLREEGVLLSSTNALVNITNYPPLETLLDRIAAFPNHVLIDADLLGRAAGSSRTANVVLLGAASLFVSLDPQLLEDVVAEMFAAKGPALVEMNRRAFRIGRNAARAYREGLARGWVPAAVRRWLDTLPAEQLLAGQPIEAALPPETTPDVMLSGAETRAVVSALEQVRQTGRDRLFEHEVYTLLEVVGAICPPRYSFVPRGDTISRHELELFPGEQVVLKIVSPQIVHKTEAAGVAFVRRDLDIVRREIDRLVQLHGARCEVAGVLVVEFVETPAAGLGSELFVGIRATREFGPVIAAGLGGIDTEFLAAKMRPGVAVAKAVASEVSPEQFLALFQRTAAYDVLAGRARGHRRVVSDGELLRCFRAFLAIARRFCTFHEDGSPGLLELEVNPFAFRQYRMIPLDGRAQLGACPPPPPRRPVHKVQNLLEPRSIGVIGVSATARNIGRIILGNIQLRGFPSEHLYVIKDHPTPIDGVSCVPNLRALPEPLDLLVIAAPAAQLPALIAEAADCGAVQSVILIPGGVGETEGSAETMTRARAAIAAARCRPDGGPVFLGPNSLGVQSWPGRYDTFFIPHPKLGAESRAAVRRVALLSQSGAFIITRVSNLETIRPAIAVSIGNQLDLTLSDLLAAIGQRNDIDTIGVYAEGFNDQDGLAFLQVLERLAAAGRTVIFYKAGRTEPGRSAAAGHTTAVAGDYDVCQAAAAQAGAIVVDTFKEFEQLLELSSALHTKRVRGTRIAAISNAGFETVGMADAIRGARYELSIPPLPESDRARLVEVLRAHSLETLVNARNPLDLTPMAGEAVYEESIRILLESDAYDAVVVSVVPLTSALRTTPDEIGQGGSLAERLPRLLAESDKPLIAVVDCGPLYDPLVRALRTAGVPCFRSCDQAIRSLGRYLCYRAGRAGGEPSATAARIKIEQEARQESAPVGAGAP